MGKFTGERCELGNMPGRMDIAQEHLTRYIYALGKLQKIGAKTVLDAACGSGYGTNLLRACDFEAYGVDINCDAIEEAKRKYGPYYERASLNDEDTLEGEHFDAVVSFETIEHLDDPDAFLEWCKTKSKYLIYSIPYKQPSQFHQHVFDMDQAMALINRHYLKNDGQFQLGTIIDDAFLCERGEGVFDGGYLVGIASM